METMADPATDAPVRKSITVATSVEHAFRVFTEDLDSWWPRTHHIGKAPMKKALIERRSGGRCYFANRSKMSTNSFKRFRPSCSPWATPSGTQLST